MNLQKIYLTALMHIFHSYGFPNSLDYLKRRDETKRLLKIQVSNLDFFFLEGELILIATEKESSDHIRISFSKIYINNVEIESVTELDKYIKGKRVVSLSKEELFLCSLELFPFTSTYLKESLKKIKKEAKMTILMSLGYKIRWNKYRYSNKLHIHLSNINLVVTPMSLALTKEAESFLVRKKEKIDSMIKIARIISHMTDEQKFNIREIKRLVDLRIKFPEKGIDELLMVLYLERR